MGGGVGDFGGGGGSRNFLPFLRENTWAFSTFFQIFLCATASRLDYKKYRFNSFRTNTAELTAMRVIVAVLRCARFGCQQTTSLRLG
jgi:hypothetical protein